MIRHFYLKFLSVFISVLIACTIVEVLLRVISPQPTYSHLLTMTGEQYVSDDVIPFTLKKSHTASAPSQEFPGRSVTYHTNSLGLRGAEITASKPAGCKRILILGDSYTFGVYVEDSETYPAQLEKLLTAEGACVQVLNAGYADGWSPDEHYAWLIDRGFTLQPDVVIYGFFIGNDISDICKECWMETDARGLPKKVRNPNVYVDTVGRIRSTTRDAHTVGAEWVYEIPLVRESHLAVRLSFAFRSIAAMLSPGAASVGHEYGQDYFSMILNEKSDDRPTAAREVLFVELVRGLRQAAHDHGAQFRLLMLPVNFQVEDRHFRKYFKDGSLKRDFFLELEPLLDADKIKFLNILKEMRAHSGKYFPDNSEVHFNPAGNRFVAERIARTAGFLD